MIKGKTSQAKKQRSRLRGERSRGEENISKLGLGKRVKESKLPSLEDFKGLPFTKGEDRVITILWNTYSALKSHGRDLKNILDGGKVPQRVRVKPKTRSKAKKIDQGHLTVPPKYAEVMVREGIKFVHRVPEDTSNGWIVEIIREGNIQKGKKALRITKGHRKVTIDLGTEELTYAELPKSLFYAADLPIVLLIEEGAERDKVVSTGTYELTGAVEGAKPKAKPKANPKDEKSYNITIDLSTRPYLQVANIKGILKEAGKDLKALLKGATTLTGSLEGLRADLFAGIAPLMMGEGGRGESEIHEDLKAYHSALYTACHRNRGDFLYSPVEGSSQTLELVNVFLGNTKGTCDNSLNDFLNEVTTSMEDLKALSEEAKILSAGEEKAFVGKVLSKNEKIIEGIYEILLNLRDEGILRDLAYNYSDRKVAFKDIWVQVKEGDTTYAKFKYLREALVAAQKNFTQGAENIYSPVTLRRNYLVTRVYNQLRRVAYYTTIKNDTQKAIAEAFKAVAAEWYTKVMADKETENARFSVEYNLLNDSQNLEDFVFEVLNSIVINEEYLQVDVVNFQETLENILSGAGGPITQSLWKYLQEQDISRLRGLQLPSAYGSLSKEELLSQLSKDEVRNSGFIGRKLAPWILERLHSAKRGDIPTSGGVDAKRLDNLEKLMKVASSITFEKKILPEVLDEYPWLIDAFGDTSLYYELFGLDNPISKKLSVDVIAPKNEVEFLKNLTKGEIDDILKNKPFLKPYRDILVSFFTGNSKKDKVTYLLALEAMKPKSTSESLEKLHKKLTTNEEKLKSDVTRRRNELASKLKLTDERDFDEGPERLKRFLDLLQESASAYKGDGKRIDSIKPFMDYKASMGKRKGTKPAVYSSLAGDYDISVPKHIPTYALRATKVYNYIRFYGNVKSLRDKVTEYKSKYIQYIKAVEDLVESTITHEGLPRELKTEKGVYVPLLGVALGEYAWINLPQTPKKWYRGKSVGFDTWVFETIVKEALRKFNHIFKPKPLEVSKSAVTLTTGSSLPLRLKRDGRTVELELRSPIVNFFYSSLIVAFGGTPIYLGGEFLDIPTIKGGKLTEVKILNEAVDPETEKVRPLNGWKDINRLVKDLRLVGESTLTLSRLELSQPTGRKVEIFGRELQPYLPYSKTITAPNELDKLLEKIDIKKSNPQEGSWFDLPLSDAWEEATSLDSFNLAQILAVMCTVLSFTTHMYADLVTPLLLDHKESPVFTQEWLTKKLMPTKQLSELLNFIEIGSDNGVLLLCARRIFAQHSPRDVNMLITLARLVSCVPGIFDGQTLETLGVSIFSMLPPKAKKMSITELLESQHGPKRLPECESVEPMKAGVWIDPGKEVVYQKIQGFWFAYPKSSSEPSKVYQEHAKRWRKINPKGNATNEGTTWYMRVPTNLLEFIDTLTEAEAPNLKYIRMYFKWLPLRLKRDGMTVELELGSPIVNFFYSSLIVAFGGTHIYLGGEFLDIPNIKGRKLTEVKILNEGWKDINQRVKTLRLVGESTLSRLELSQPNGGKVEIFGRELQPYLPYSKTTMTQNATNEGTTWYMRVPTNLLEFIDTLTDAEASNLEFIRDYFEW